ncbi:DUF885 family protein [Spirosoma sp. HMF4905]|uniref:DUF885 family protein n=1 Tax=Spirosoma arboris TaxID=2682092 RepID=A0A7K1S5H1_9BACT|nr:DUF885 domain-containing protein [Spirosoma arboris]MVM29034.1 DUF885 family protein [Spirosoma arboris]
MTIKKRTWKPWVFRSLAVLLLAGSIWIINLIWFRPFSIRHFYDRVFISVMLRSPEMITYLGLPILYDWTKDQWDDLSDAQQWHNFELLKDDYQTLKSYDFESQSTENKLNTKILDWYLESNVGSEAFFYYNYPLNQMDGAQLKVVDLLLNKHQLRNKSDMDAYITRLTGIATKFDQVLEGLQIRERKGIVPPKIIVQRVLEQMKAFVNGGVSKNILYTNFCQKIASIKDLPADDKKDYSNRVAEAIRTSVFGAYQKLIAHNQALYARAAPDEGAWKHPHGDAFYSHQLRVHTTTNLSSEEIHQIGLQEVNRISQEMWSILRTQGYADTSQSIGKVMQGLTKQERFLYPETPAGKALILAEYKRIIDEASKRVNVAFALRPKASITVEPVPVFQQASTPLGKYDLPALDGSKGGVFVANLRASSDHPKFAMKTLAYHEAIPGHHFQLGIQTELKGLPIFRTVIPFTAYLEGWALYTEQLAYELGFYKNDPFGNLGRLQSELFRAVRLVVDTGIHHKKWTREKAIDYMTSHTGMSSGEVTIEVERYMVWPGQACAYKIGMMKILELREKARQVLGSRFDLKQFHQAVLANGSVPLPILEEIVNTYIQQSKP